MPEFLGIHMGGHHSEVHQPITETIYLSPKFLLFNIQPYSRQDALASLCLSGTDQNSSLLQPPFLESTIGMDLQNTHRGNAPFLAKAHWTLRKRKVAHCLYLTSYLYRHLHPVSPRSSLSRATYILQMVPLYRSR